MTAGGGFVIGSGGGGATTGGTSAASGGQGTIPAGLENLPQPQNCTDSQTECNGNCIDLTNPDAGGCLAVGNASVVQGIALDQGYVYFTDYNGVSRVNVSTGAENLLTSHQSRLVAVSGSTTYFTGSLGASAGIYSVPSTGGTETNMASATFPMFLGIASGWMGHRRSASEASTRNVPLLLLLTRRTFTSEPVGILLV